LYGTATIRPLTAIGRAIHLVIAAFAELGGDAEWAIVLPIIWHSPARGDAIRPQNLA